MSQTSNSPDPRNLPASRDQFESTEELHEHIRELPSVSGLNEDYLYQNNTSRFRVELTPFPTLDAGELEPGMLVYHPTDPVAEVKEILKGPYKNEQGYSRIDTRTHYWELTDDGFAYRTFEHSDFTQHILLEYTHVPVKSIQMKLGDMAAP